MLELKLHPRTQKLQLSEHQGMQQNEKNPAIDRTEHFCKLYKQAHVLFLIPCHCCEEITGFANMEIVYLFVQALSHAGVFRWFQRSLSGHLYCFSVQDFSPLTSIGFVSNYLCHRLDLHLSGREGYLVIGSTHFSFTSLVLRSIFSRIY